MQQVLCPLRMGLAFNQARQLILIGHFKGHVGFGHAAPILGELVRVEGPESLGHQLFLQLGVGHGFGHDAVQGLARKWRVGEARLKPLQIDTGSIAA